METLKLLLVILSDLVLKGIVWYLLKGEVLFPKHSGDQTIMLFMFVFVTLSLLISFKLINGGKTLFFKRWLLLMFFQNVVYIIYCFYSYRTVSGDFISLSWDYLLWELVIPTMLLATQVIFYLYVFYMKKK